MREEQKKEVAIIPAGNYISIMGCRLILLEDTKVDVNQANLDYILGHQKNFYSQGKSCMVSSHQESNENCQCALIRARQRSHDCNSFDRLFIEIDNLLQKQIDQFSKIKIESNINRKHLIKELGKLIKKLSNET